jgi:hypothetical protein
VRGVGGTKGQLVGVQLREEGVERSGQLARCVEGVGLLRARVPKMLLGRLRGLG